MPRFFQDCGINLANSIAKPFSIAEFFYSCYALSHTPLHLTFHTKKFYLSFHMASYLLKMHLKHMLCAVQVDCSLGL